MSLYQYPVVNGNASNSTTHIMAFHGWCACRNVLLDECEYRHAQSIVYAGGVGFSPNNSLPHSSFTYCVAEYHPGWQTVVWWRQRCAKSLQNTRTHTPLHRQRARWVDLLLTVGTVYAVAFERTALPTFRTRARTPNTRAPATMRHRGPQRKPNRCATFLSKCRRRIKWRSNQ